jgi:hypothetical protein
MSGLALTRVLVNQGEDAKGAAALHLVAHKVPAPHMIAMRLPPGVLAAPASHTVFAAGVCAPAVLLPGAPSPRTSR